MKNSINRDKMKYIGIRGARLHNLKNIDVDIPHNRFTVITGVSGSGKSSLAFDTLYAEGQRRFVESLSAYARQFLERMAKPDVDSITGIPPAIAIGQKPPSKNPRSTVGTTTEIYDYMRLMFARIGTTICKDCGNVVQKDTPQTVANEILKLNDGTKIYILFQMHHHKKDIIKELDNYKESGFFRIVLKGSDEIINYSQTGLPKAAKADNLYILADRLVIQKDPESVSRLTDSIESAFSNGMGKIIIRNLETQEETRYSNLFECANCEIIYMEPEPRLFSFNNPYGACPNCQGFGRTIGIDESLVIPNRNLSIKAGAIYPFRTVGFSEHNRILLRKAITHGIDTEAPISSFTSEQIKYLWEGDGEYIGIDGFFRMLEEQAYKMHYRILMSKYRGYTRCRSCNGSRIRTSARQVFINGINIPELITFPLEKLLDYFKNLDLTENQRSISGQLLEEIIRRISLLVDIGLEYITLDRLSHTLSGGESQRINLSTALGSSLVGTLYVLDEPSIGLHQRDTDRLISILIKLRNLGNTVVVVEHDLDIIKKADNIIDMGPKAGEKGGELVFSGKFEEISKAPESLTGKYFSGEKKIEIPQLRNPGNGKAIKIFGPAANNLKMPEVTIPLGCINVITGVSGSGKSSLIHDVLYAGLKNSREEGQGIAGRFEMITGGDNIEYVEMVDQSPIGKSSRSTPATYTKAFDHIREVFAQTQLARQFGWKPGYFSFNVPGGRCDVCDGEGSVTVDMQFLPDLHLECEACKGTRYKKELRNILFKGKSIVDVLDMTIDEAIEFFKGIPKVTNKLNILSEVGLGYLKLGQPSSMLSGGESQRVKLANHLDSSSPVRTMFIFDEPTTGLHIDDISRLIDCFRKLISGGHSVVIIEHNLHIISSADWIIDLGPGAGENGGEIIAMGTPEKVARDKNSFTGKALKEFFESI